ncbi:MAG: chemotaxis protein CheB, partial [Acidobacteria bacterium]|nr:chemotaxis protein CheB [Acidobacteriota bacterium]
GLMVVKREGGIAIVQDPAEASYSGMPQSAVDNVAVDYIVPIASIPGLLVSLVTGKESAGSGPGGNPGEPNRDRKEEGFA